MTKVLIDMCRSASYSVSSNSSDMQHLENATSKKIVDFKISNGEMNSVSSFIDVTIVNTSDDDNATEFACTDRAEREKKIKHAYIEELNHGKFIPLAFAYGGAWGKSAGKFIPKIIKHIDKSSFLFSKLHEINWSCSTPSNYWRQRFSCTLQYWKSRGILDLICKSIGQHGGALGG